MNTQSLVHALSFGFLLASIVSQAAADLPRAPIIIEAASGGCSPIDEICGDGVDQDCNGSDLLCPGPDQDRDGYPNDQDCDDTQRMVYPSVSVPCSADCGQGTKTCQSNGQFTTCSCTPLCEAKGSGKCYYVSKLTGSDSNPGTFLRPWKTVKMFASADSKPSGSVTLKPGDVVYMMSGVYDETVSYGNYTAGLILYGINGTSLAPITIKAYPGAHPVIDPAAQVEGIQLENTDNFIFEGLEITRAYGFGFSSSGAENLELKNMWVHDIDGVDNHNIAGVHLLAVVNSDVHHSLIHDNYDRTNADTGGLSTENSRNIVIFKGGPAKIRHSVIFQSPPINAPKTGACLGYKHSADTPGATFEVSHNVFWNCFNAAIQSYTYGGRFHHNLILNSERAFRIWSSGDYTDLSDYIIEKNTIIDTQVMDYRPSSVNQGGGDYSPLVYRYNISIFSGPYTGDSGGMHNIDPYGPDSVHDDMFAPGAFVLNNNCYYNPGGSVSINFFYANDAAERLKGRAYSFSAWKSLGFDTNSVATNPLLNSQFVPASPSCQNAGMYAP